MQDFWKNVAALIKVKTIVTLIVVTVFAVLALRGGLQPDTGLPRVCGSKYEIFFRPVFYRAGRRPAGRCGSARLPAE